MSSSKLLNDTKALIEPLEKSLLDADINKLSDAHIVFLRQLLISTAETNDLAEALDKAQQFIEAYTILRKDEKILKVNYATRCELILIAQKIEETRNSLKNESEPQQEEKNQTKEQA